MLFDIICCDPPWKFSDALSMTETNKRGASANYSCLSTKTICDIPVKSLANPTGCLLALWVPGSLLADGLKVMDAYGFKQKQVYTWVKTKKEAKDIDNCLNFGMGRLFRQSHEIALIGINNSGIYKKLKNKSQRSVSLAPNLKHSQKPPNLQDSLDLMFGDQVKKIEVFARKERQGWYTIGNECKSTLNEDIFVSVQNLINL